MWMPSKRAGAEFSFVSCNPMTYTGGRLNFVHPLPPFDNMTAFAQVFKSHVKWLHYFTEYIFKVLDRMEELGLWLMYEMQL
jgi:hypothetical protein